MSYELKRNSKLFIVSSPAATAGNIASDAAAITITTGNITDFMAANVIPGVTDFGYDHELGVERRGKGQFGANKPVGLTEEYGGIKGNFDVEGSDGEKAVLAAIGRVLRASYVHVNYNKLYESFVFGYVATDDGAAMTTHFLDTCKVDGVPKKVGPDAKRFSLQGIIGHDFAGKELRLIGIDGNALPVVTVNLPAAEPYQWTDESGVQHRYLAVLRYDGTLQTVTRLQKAAAAAAGYYAETDADTITLHADDDLAATDKLLIAYVK